MSGIVVIGSINMDLVTRLERHPRPGETVAGHDTAYHSGGKGANQAVAAARSGAKVKMFGAVGTDAFANQLVQGLREYGVDTDYIAEIDGPSGLAIIAVDSAGENNIIISSGANVRLDVEALEGALLGGLFHGADLVLLQNEIPLEVNRRAMVLAKAHGLKVVWNPAPVGNMQLMDLSDVDMVVVNEIEAELLTGVVPDCDKAFHEVVNSFFAIGVKEVIVTLGRSGVIYGVEGKDLVHQRAFAVPVEDTTAAGDTFVGTYVAGFARGENVPKALRFASAASALAVSKEGAQTSIPSVDEVQRFLAASPIQIMD